MAERKYYMIQRIDDGYYVEYVYRNGTSFDRDEGDAIELESLEDAKVFLKYVKKIRPKDEKYRIIANVTTINCEYSEDETEQVQ